MKKTGTSTLKPGAARRRDGVQELRIGDGTGDPPT
jgi:hypothetical protein